ncbi:MAG: alpha-amylase [Bacteroidales bacterium]|nr:alpha-amylase [Bacteroidales bacterium]
MKRFLQGILALSAGLALLAGASCNKTGGENGGNGGGNSGGGSGTPVETGSQLADVTYQLNVYSFADSDGDGWGDLKGVTQHLDYFESLGVSALWLSPVQAAMSYHGYNVTDYSAINPKLGTEADFKDLIGKAGAKGIDIYMDYVLNHSGSDNAWFKEACSSADSKYRSYYVFSDNPAADVAAGKIDNYAGAKTPGMGTWYTLSGSTGSGRLHFKLDWNARKVTVTQSTEAAQASNPSATKWLYYGNGTEAGLYATGGEIYEITVDFASDWGFLIRTATGNDWGVGKKYGAPNGAGGLTLGQPYPIAASTSSFDPGNITFAGGTSYFASFDKSMPDLNYGPYDKAAESAAFKDLAASADKWIKLGVNGLRLDAVLWIYQQQTSANVAFLKAWYDHCNATYKARGGSGEFYMVGEAWTGADEIAAYYKGLPSCFNFPYWDTLKDRINKGRGSDFATTVSGFRNQFRSNRSDFIDAIKLSNHDEDRTAESLGRSLDKEKLAAAVLLTSPGKPFIYQGEELGYWGNKGGGDEYVRAPIKWTRSGSVPTAALSGKVDNAMLSDAISVEAQSADEASLLSVYRKFSKARNSYKALAKGEITPVSSTNNALALWTLSFDGQTVLVAHNFGSGVVSASVSGISELSADRILVSNGVASVNGSSVTLGAYASAVFAL